MIRRTTDKEALYEKCIPEPNSGCWIWTDACNASGYGKFWFKKKHYAAHRASWELHFSNIPKKMLVCHKCDNPSCVNPYHLFLGTNQDNVNDMMQKKRHRGNIKFTKEQVIEVRRLRLLGLTHTKIAEIMDAPKSRISDICIGRCWKNI